MGEHEGGAEAGLSGVVEDVKGKAKEVAGSITGKEGLRKEGRSQQDKAAAERDVAESEAKAEKARAEADLQESRQKAHQQDD
ncbi:MAG: CsbD family protein [Acidimicrobiia bacterium]|nr:CsbD family protein [Acidimicrobiia bacterium]